MPGEHIVTSLLLTRREAAILFCVCGNISGDQRDSWRGALDCSKYGLGVRDILEKAGLGVSLLGRPGVAATEWAMPYGPTLRLDGSLAVHEAPRWMREQMQEARSHGIAECELHHDNIILYLSQAAVDALWYLGRAVRGDKLGPRAFFSGPAMCLNSLLATWVSDSPLPDSNPFTGMLDINSASAEEVAA